MGAKQWLFPKAEICRTHKPRTYFNAQAIKPDEKNITRCHPSLPLTAHHVELATVQALVNFTSIFL